MIAPPQLIFTDSWRALPGTPDHLCHGTDSVFQITSTRSILAKRETVAG